MTRDDVILMSDSRQSKTVEQAADTYRHRYGRNPPKGFDVWFKWAKENDVKIVDDVSVQSSSATCAIAISSTRMVD